MLDNVLLEKRNRYVTKMIQRTNQLSDSIKLLNSIDNQLHMQSGGAFHSQSGGSITKLNYSLTELQKNIDDARVHQPNNTNQLKKMNSDIDIINKKITNIRNTTNKINNSVDMVTGRISDLIKQFDMSISPVIISRNYPELNSIIRNLDKLTTDIDNKQWNKILNMLNDTQINAEIDKYLNDLKRNPYAADKNETAQRVHESINIILQNNYTQDNDLVQLVKNIFKILIPMRYASIARPAILLAPSAPSSPRTKEQPPHRARTTS